jgi:integrase
MSDVFDRYEKEYAPKLRPSSRSRMMQVVRHAREWFEEGPNKGRTVHSITPSDIQALLEYKRADGVGPRTVNIYRANLHRVFQLCVRPWLLIRSNPVDGTEPQPHDARQPLLLSDSEYGALTAACEDQPMLSLFVVLAWQTGARRSELLQLRWECVDLVSGNLTFANDPVRGVQTKTRRTRTVPLSIPALEALRLHAAQFRLLSPRSPYVFKHLRRSRGAEPGMRIENIYRGFKSAARRIGIPELRPHDLRHSFVTRKLAQGIPAQLVSKYVGHSDLATTLRYTHLVSEHLIPVVKPDKALREVI